jgi:hypothetical protein
MDERYQRAKPYRKIRTSRGAGTSGGCDQRVDVDAARCFRTRLPLIARDTDSGTKGVSDPLNRAWDDHAAPGKGSLTPFLLLLLCARAGGGGIERRRAWPDVIGATCSSSGHCSRVATTRVGSPPILACLSAFEVGG